MKSWCLVLSWASDVESCCALTSVFVHIGTGLLWFWIEIWAPSASNIWIYVRILDLDCVNMCGGCFSESVPACVHVCACQSPGCISGVVTLLIAWCILWLHLFTLGWINEYYCWNDRPSSWNLIFPCPDHLLMKTHFPTSLLLLLPFPSASTNSRLIT